MAMTGFVGILHLTSLRGIGMSFNAVIYIAAARHWLGETSPVLAQNIFLSYKFTRLHFPPFFPLLLSWCSRLSGNDPMEAVRWLHATFYACDFLLIGYLLEKYTRSWGIVIAGTSVACLSSSMLSNYSSALSEPTFIFFTLLWLISFMDFLGNAEHRLSFVVSILMIMFASATRLSAVAIVFTSVAATLLFLKKGMRGKLVSVMLLAGFGLLPIFLWMGINEHAVGITNDRTLAFHPPPASYYNLLQGFSLVRLGILPFPLRCLVLVLSTISMILGWVMWGKRDQDAVDRTPAALMIFISVLSVFCLVYGFGLVLTMIFVDPSLSSNDRTLLPMRLIFIILIAILVHVLLTINTQWRLLKGLFIITLVLCIVGTNSIEALHWASRRYEMGDGYNSKAWQDSPIIALAKKIPSTEIIYTNDSLALYVAARRDSLQIYPHPIRHQSSLISANGIFMAKMAADLESHQAVLVYCNSVPHCNAEANCFSSSDLPNKFPLKLAAKGSDGAIYAWDDQFGSAHAF